MKKTENKEVKKVTKKAEVKETKVETKKEEVKKVEKPTLNLTIQDIMNMYADVNIKCFNPDAKGNYRIMGSKKGSSLNLHTQCVTIYSTQEDYDNVVKAAIEGVECTQGTNSQDKSRPNTVVVRSKEVLEKVLSVYAQNTLNLIPADK